MKRRFFSLTAAIFAFGAMNFFYGQENKEILNWYNGASPGMNTEKAYKSLKKKPTKTVIVAVIDSGIDIEHEDLQGKIWNNDDEIPGNGVDDDNNGYIDDMHGWNFLGSPAGNQDHARLEMTRIYANLSPRFEGKTSDQIAAADRADYDQYLEIKGKLESERAQYESILPQYEQLKMVLPMLRTQLETHFGKKDFTMKDLENWKPATPEETQLKQVGMAMVNGDLSEEAIEEGVQQLSSMLNYHLNPDYNDREFIGDNPDDFNDVHYGNADVEGADALHGTHVGGIIGAVRGNGKGGDGVANDVKLMSLRAVPDGDESDKDIALAIRYAVDNGASVINMSFGKAYSVHQKEVYEALKYADSKGVLLVHAAGNENENVDVNNNFPTNHYSFQQNQLANYLTIGASTRFPKGNLAADFSNYGATRVDVFAPGYEIYNTVPQSSYKKLQGTSMAAPMVAGAAAFLKSYFPELTMLQIKEVMLRTAKPYKGTMQTLPGAETQVDFATLSTTGGVIDLAAASKECAKMVKAMK